MRAGRRIRLRAVRPPGRPAEEARAGVLRRGGRGHGHEPGEIVYVGDNYHHDVVAPAAAGMRTVWVNRGGRDLPGPVVPDLVVERLAQRQRCAASPDRPGDVPRHGTGYPLRVTVQGADLRFR
ncbi:HAD family hydrolase [Catellatospora coxensis]